MSSINWAGLGWLCVFVWAFIGLLVCVLVIVRYSRKPEVITVDPLRAFCESMDFTEEETRTICAGGVVRREIPFSSYVNVKHLKTDPRKWN